MASEATKIPFVEGSAPSTPAANRVVTYAKADGLMYSKDDAGVETLMSSGSAGTGTVTTVKDEGVNLSTAVVSLDFVGAGVTATGTTAVTVTIPGGGGGSNFLAFFPGLMPTSAVTGTWVMIDFASDAIVYPYGNRAFYNSSAAQNDALSFDIWMDAGTYSVTCFFRKSSNTSIITVNLDGSSQGTIDTYAASPAYGNGSITGSTVAAGKRTWQFKAATKNASSAGYATELFGIAIYRTA